MSTKKTSPPVTPDPAAVAQARVQNEQLRSRLTENDWTVLTKYVERLGGTFADGVVTKCPQKLRKRNCVAPARDSEPRKMAPQYGKKINEELGTRINFDKVASWEGGQHTQAYVPWWPTVKALDPSGSMSIDETRNKIKSAGKK